LQSVLGPAIHYDAVEHKNRFMQDVVFGEIFAE
jgi:hypothetical protein